LWHERCIVEVNVNVVDIDIDIDIDIDDTLSSTTCAT
jgi:hypothetical protein